MSAKFNPNFAAHDLERATEKLIPAASHSFNDLAEALAIASTKARRTTDAHQAEVIANAQRFLNAMRADINRLADLIHEATY